MYLEYMVLVLFGVVALMQCTLIGIDTRQLTKRIREKGTMLGKVGH